MNIRSTPASNKTFLPILSGLQHRRLERVFLLQCPKPARTIRTYKQMSLGTIDDWHCRVQWYLFECKYSFLSKSEDEGAFFMLLGDMLLDVVPPISSCSSWVLSGANTEPWQPEILLYNTLTYRIIQGHSLRNCIYTLHSPAAPTSSTLLLSIRLLLDACVKAIHGNWIQSQRK